MHGAGRLMWDGGVQVSQESWRQGEDRGKRKEGTLGKWFSLHQYGIHQTQTVQSPPLSLLVCVFTQWYLTVVLYLAETGRRISKRGSEGCCYLPSSLERISHHVTL